MVSLVNMCVRNLMVLVVLKGVQFFREVLGVLGVAMGVRDLLDIWWMEKWV